MGWLATVVNYSFAFSPSFQVFSLWLGRNGSNMCHNENIKGEEVKSVWDEE